MTNHKAEIVRSLPSIFSIFVDIFINPDRGFREGALRRSSIALVPLSLTIICTIALDIYYYDHVNIAWLADMLANGFNPAQRAAMSAVFSRTHLIAISAISVLLLVTMVDAARTGFFWLVLKARGQSAPYGKLFGVVTWAAMPLLLVLPAGILNINLAHSGQIAPNDVNPTSLNQLFFHMAGLAGWGRLWSTLTLVGLWEIALHAVGIRAVAGTSIRAAVVIALAPVVVVYGIWAASLIIASLPG